jgi:AcrR family transcriptional regulator
MRNASPRSAAAPIAPATGRARDAARAVFRNAILDAAESVFAERGFHGARIQDIARGARTAVGTVYNHFEQKEDVLRALLDERTLALLTELAAREDDPDPFEARLVARLGRLLRYVDTHRGFFALAIDHGLLGASTAAAASVLGGRDPKRVTGFRDALQEIAAEGVRAGALAPLDPVRLARLLGGILRAFTVGLLHGEAGPLAGEAQLLVQLFLHGAAPPRRAPPVRAATIVTKRASRGQSR